MRTTILLLRIPMRTCLHIFQIFDSAPGSNGLSRWSCDKSIFFICRIFFCSITCSYITTGASSSTSRISSTKTTRRRRALKMKTTTKAAKRNLVSYRLEIRYFKLWGSDYNREISVGRCYGRGPKSCGRQTEIVFMCPSWETSMAVLFLLLIKP